MVATNRMIEAQIYNKNGLSDKSISIKMSISEQSVRRYLRAAKLLDRAEQSENKSSPRILVFDIETSPMAVLVWGLFEQRIPPQNVIAEWAVLSWSAKWLCEPEILYSVVTPDEAKDRQDYNTVKKMWDLFEEAVIVIAHNAANFDLRKLNARWKVNGFTPPSSFQVIDTLKISRKHFAFASHKLDYLMKLLQDTGKVKTDFDLWKRCINGEQEALDEMVYYNKNDVVILEDLYLELRPWIKSHPNMGLYVDTDKEICPTCGSDKLDWNISMYYTPSGRYKSFRCECGSIGRSRTSDLTKEERSSLVMSTAR